MGRLKCCAKNINSTKTEFEMERSAKKRRHSDKRKHSSEESDSYDSDSDTSSGDSSSDGESVDKSPVKTKKAKNSKHGKKHKRETGKSKKKSSTSKKKSVKKPRSENMISEDDYYRKSTEFRSWLTEERKIFFSDLTSDKSRKLFRKFVTKWNDGDLPKVYYKGQLSGAINQSSYKWKLSNVDKIELGSVTDSVSSWTSGKSSSEQFSPPPQPSKSKPIGPTMIGPLPPGYQLSSSDPWALEEQEEEKRKQHKHEAKEFRKYHNMVMDELLPKATGKEARIEKKKIEREKKRTRETSPEVSDKFLMGSSGKGIQERIEHRQQAREKKASSAMEKLSEYQAKEKAKAAAILEMARAAKKEGALWK